MDGEDADQPGLRPLVPPVGAAADPVALHRHGVELIAAANRLAVSWLREATAQHAALTRRALAEMTASAKELAEAEGAAEQARDAGNPGPCAAIGARHGAGHHRPDAADP
jgi:hypothetical protein